MSNSSSEELNIVLGQLEEELRQVESARQQVEDVVSGSTKLTESLERLVSSTNNLVKESISECRKASASITKEASILSECSEDIRREASEGITTIRTQTTNAQATLENTAKAITEGISVAAEQLSTLAQSTERTSTEAMEALRCQANDSQATLEQTASLQVERSTTEIQALAAQSVTTLNDGISGAKNEIDDAKRELTAAASNARESSDALLQAHGDATAEFGREINETRALLDETQKQLAEVSPMVSTLDGFDIDGIFRQLEIIHTTEQENTIMLAKRLTIVTIVTGFCLVICVILLVQIILT